MQIDDSFEMDALLPAVVVGRCEPVAQRALVKQRGRRPGWLAWWQHQYGGYACLQSGLTGVVLPLEPRATGSERAAVVSGLRALGEGAPHGPEMRAFPALRSLHLTARQPYARGQLDTLEAFLRRGFDLPRLVRGEEALVSFERHDISETFCDWPMVIEERGRWVIGEARFGAQHLADLETWLSPPRRREPALRAYLVWSNSD